MARTSCGTSFRMSKYLMGKSTEKSAQPPVNQYKRTNKKRTVKSGRFNSPPLLAAQSADNLRFISGSQSNYAINNLICDKRKLNGGSAKDSNRKHPFAGQFRHIYTCHIRVGPNPLITHARLLVSEGHACDERSVNKIYHISGSTVSSLRGNRRANDIVHHRGYNIGFSYRFRGCRLRHLDDYWRHDCRRSLVFWRRAT